MAITVEDGTIVVGANSYVSEGEAETYHEDRGNTAWASATGQEEALVRAAFAIENRYRGYWRGYMTDNNDGVLQQLAWPRRDSKPDTYTAADGKPEVDVDDTVYDENGRRIGINEIPIQLKHAQMEAALIELTERVMPTGVDSSGYVTKEKVGPIEREYAPNKPSVTVFPILDHYLSGLALTGPNSFKMNIIVTDEEQAALDTPSSTTAWNDYFGVDVL